MISVLFVRKGSIYKTLGVDCWDIERDARLWPGGNAIVAHPPCRAWGRLRHMANPRPDEKDLARQTVKWIRQFGGVLEHPSGSTLWGDMALPMPGEIDHWGGYAICVDQFWWGHSIKKKNGRRIKKEIIKREREETPIEFARFLIKIAEKVA